jgi:hypothetical protein
MATITLDIKSELPKAIRWTDSIVKQLPFAISQALNSTGFDMRTSLNSATRQYFDKPAPFTQRSFIVQKGSKRDLQVTVLANKRQNLYLRTQVSGGPRKQKGFERKFLADIVGTQSIPSNTQLAPTALIKLNAQGNVSLATIKRIQQGISSTAKAGFFAGVPKGTSLPFGIYRRSKGKLLPYFVATSGPARYRPRFPMQEIGTKVVERRFGQYLRSALERAIASAR